MKAEELRIAIGRVRQLPTLPAILGQIQETIADPKSSAIDLAKHITADQTLAAQMLRLVNSAYYGFSREINEVVDAVAILGFNGLQELVLTTTTFSSLPKSDSAYDRMQLWRHSLAVGMAEERCAKRAQLPRGAGFFSAGLLHDIGKVTLDLLYPNLLSEAADKAHSENKHICTLEPEFFGMDHACAGGLLAEHWGLPKQVIEAISYHHEPDRSIINSKLTHLTAFADFLTYEAGLGESSSGSPPDPPGDVAEFLGFPETQWAELVDDVRGLSECIDGYFGALSG